jgi:glycerol-3-phosphate cytidylyltransferase
MKQRVGITFSAFDLLHAGHIQMLKDAKRQCDFLIVGLQVDPSIERPQKNKPIQSVVERYIQLEGCKYVDKIVPYVMESDLEDILLSYEIDVRIIGEEYQFDSFTGRKICKENDIELYYNKRKHRFSSSSLRQIIKDS